MSRTTIFAVLASALLLLSVAAPALAIEAGSLDVSVSQDSSGAATVAVTGAQNNSSVAVSGASVTVSTVDPNATYAGTGSYTTDANGTVSLAAPNESVEVSVTASYDNESASTTATLSAGEGDDETDDGNATAFGQRVSSFVAMLQSNETANSSDNSSLLAQRDDAKNMGVLIATFVTANNPGNAPAHAGPPAWLLDGSVEKTNGPPDHATGADENESTGPPDDRGNGNAASNGNGNGGGPPDDKDKGGGPPAHAGPPDDGDDDSDDGDD